VVESEKGVDSVIAEEVLSERLVAIVAAKVSLP
jgi:hypothetical protein